MISNIMRNIGKNLEKIWFSKIQPLVRQAYFDERFFKLLNRPLFELFRFAFMLAPISKRFHITIPAFDATKTNMSWLPINETIEGVEQSTLTLEILDRLIEKSHHRVVLNFCPCRTCCSCEDYPQTIGCLLMGETALLVPEKSRTEVSIEEAKDHARRAMQAGLIPIAGKARIDNDFMQLPDENKLFTVCFCCECCCVARFNRYMPVDELDSTLHPIEGLSIKITDECVGCGKCVEACYIGAIEVINKRAVLSDKCRVCGRCALFCPQDAIKLTLSNPHAADDVINRIGYLVEY